MTEVRAVVTLFVGIGLLIVGIRVRHGDERRWVRVYRNAALPRIVRNGPLVLIPSGVTLVVGAIAQSSSVFPALDAIKLPLAIAVLISFGAIFVALSSPPAFLLPKWFRESESERISNNSFDRSIEVVGWIGATIIVVGLVVLILMSRG